MTEVEQTDHEFCLRAFESRFGEQLPSKWQFDTYWKEKWRDWREAWKAGQKSLARECLPVFGPLYSDIKDSGRDDRERVGLAVDRLQGVADKFVVTLDQDGRVVDTKYPENKS